MRRGTLEIERWWQRLSPAERRSLARPGERRSLQLVGRFVEPGEDGGGDDTTDLYEYVVNHELVFVGERTFHICSAHPEARAAVSSGLLPATFQCPRGAESCPMRRLLHEHPGCDLRLSLEEVAR